MFNKIYEKIKKFLKENYKSLIVLIIFAVICLYEFPYVIYTPGGVVSLNERIEVENGYEAKGSFNMSYVSMRKATLPMLGLSYIIPNWDVLKKEEVTIEDESVDDLMKLEKLYMDSSINNATILAYQKAQKELNITRNINNIVFISDEANTNLHLYDELISADGTLINNINDLKKVVASKKVGDKVNIIVNRNGKENECTATVYNTSDGLKIGVAFLTTYEYDTNPKIKVKTKSSESGSSGGLMLSLAIYNSLVEEDLTKGRVIVGTGTIDPSGNVGAIDGVKYKILGATKNHVDLFICPKENYEEAIKVKDEFNLDLEIIPVLTFDEAIQALK